jgi:hypothetical protein
MAHVFEFFGYLATDRSPAALGAASHAHCPFLGQTCIKTLSDGVISGACAMKPATTGPVICCPIRLYADDYRILRDVSDAAFEEGLLLVPGPSARAESRRLGHPVVGVFGKKWGGELRLPQRQGTGGYFVDWILALVDADGELAEFVAIEVQTIDTTGNYRASRLGLLADQRPIVQSTTGLNWENVNKRILPQLIYKGQVLQREEKCKKGLFFICPTPVYKKVMDRLGGSAGLTEFHLQPASVTFLGYDYANLSVAKPGELVPIALEVTHSTTVYKLQERFGNVELPKANVYRDAIETALGNS